MFNYVLYIKNWIIGSGSEILQETSFGFGSGSEIFFGFVTALLCSIMKYDIPWTSFGVIDWIWLANTKWVFLFVFFVCPFSFIFYILYYLYFISIKMISLRNVEVRTLNFKDFRGLNHNELIYIKTHTY